MKLTNKQKFEVSILAWFSDKPFNDNDIRIFFEYSDKGMHKELGLNLGGNPLLIAKKHRDITVKQWMEDWGDTLNAWSFLDEPQFIVEWIAKTLDRESIIMAWHENKYRWWKPWSWKHKQIVAHYQQTIDNKSLNKPLEVRRSS